MAKFNIAKREVSYKIVYYGPSSSGKTTNLRIIDQRSSHTKGEKLATVAVGINNDLFFEFLPINVGVVRGVYTTFQLFAIPGGEGYNSVRKLILQDVDGIVFVADSTYMEQNSHSLKNLLDNLEDLGRAVEDIPMVIQWNKRDRSDALSIAQLKAINNIRANEFAASAISGEGVFSTIESLADVVVEKNIEKYPQEFLQREQAQIKQSISFVTQTKDTRKLSSRAIPNKQNNALLASQPTKFPEKAKPVAKKASERRPECPDDFHIEEVRRRHSIGEIVMLKISGKIDQRSIPFLENQVHEYYARGNFNLMLDLEKIEHFHSTAFGMLLSIANRAKMMGGGVCLFNVPEKTRVFLDLMGVDHCLTLANTQDDAMLGLTTTIAQGKKQFGVTSIRPAIKVRSPKPPDSTKMKTGKKFDVADKLSTTQSVRVSEYRSEQGGIQSIFISYAEADAQTAENVEQVLGEKFDVWRDGRRLQPGTTWSPEISQYLLNSNIVILIWSEHSANNLWMNHEWIAALALGKKIIIALTQSDLPFPAPLQSVSTIAVDNIQEQFMALLEKRKVADINMIPIKSHLPLLPLKKFHGREQEMLTIYHKLLTTHRVVVNQAASNICGIGKTRLALEFAYRFGHAFPQGILWINALENWEQEFCNAAVSIGLPVSPWTNNNLGILIELRKYLHSHPQTLVIIDNIEDFSQLQRDIIPGFNLGNCNIYLLCTSRNEKVADDFSTLSLQALSEQDAYELLTSNKKPASSLGEEAAKEIARLLAQAPLALELTQAFLQENMSIPFNDHLHTLANKLRLASLNWQGKIAALTNKLWELVQDDNSRILLQIIGQFPERKVLEKATLTMMAGVDQEQSAKAFTELAHLSLIIICTQEHVRLHPDTQKFLHSLLPTEQLPKFRLTAAENLFHFYFNFRRLEQECQHRGLEVVTRDLNLAVSWSSEQPKIKLFRDVFLAEKQGIKKYGYLKNFISQQLYSRMYINQEQQIQELTNGLSKGVWLKRANCCAPQQISAAENITWNICVAFSPSHRQLLITNGDKIELWNTNPVEKTATIIERYAASRDVRFAKEGKHILFGNFNKLQLWELKTKKSIFTRSKHNNWILATACSMDRSMFASAGKDQQVILWDRSGQQIQNFVGHKGSVTILCFAPAKPQLLSGSDDKTLKVWETKTGRELLSLSGHFAPITCADFFGDGKLIISGSQDGLVKIWDANNGREILNFAEHSGKITSVSCSPNNLYVVSAAEDKTIRLWDANSGQTMQIFHAMYSIIRCEFSSDGKSIWACDCLPQPTIYHFSIMGI